MTVAQLDASSWTTQGVIRDGASPHAKLHSVPIRAVKMGPGFWSARIKVNAEQSIPTLLEQFEDYGVVDNFRRLSDSKRFDHRGRLSTDADLYKWMEPSLMCCNPVRDLSLRPEWTD
jgi:hypothetical protein